MKMRAQQKKKDKRITDASCKPGDSFPQGPEKKGGEDRHLANFLRRVLVANNEILYDKNSIF